MKKRTSLFGLLFLVNLVGLQAQTSYYYYSGSKKQYLELDTRQIFVSVAAEDTTQVFFAKKLHNSPLRADVSDKIQSENPHRQKRFWTKLNLEENLSDTAYFVKMAEIKNSGEDVIVSSYFKTQYQDKIGLSNFFYVKLKSLSDTVLLYREVEKEDAVLVLQNEFMPLWFVVNITKNSRYNAMEMANRFYETDLFFT